MRRDRSRWSRLIVASALAVALGSAACGSDSDTSSDADLAESVAVPAVITFEVTEGGPAMVVGFRGNFVDPENPFLGHVVAEELGSAELLAGEITTFDLP